ncbi:MAG: hypothetical protein PHT69_01140 [Bacteroidales bacterium]|nr:hypothetical protein [Bacteroidales bacterium]
MEKVLARIISILFHPLLMSTYGLLILFQIKTYVSYSIPLKAKLTLLGLIFINTVVLPVIMIYFLKMRGLISDFQMENKKDRIIPYIITIIFYFSTFYILRKFQLPSVIYFIVLGSTCLVILALVINFWWKISAHMIGIGGLLGTFTGISIYLSINMGVLIAAMVLIAGFIGFARLKLNSHTQAQVYSGFILGVGFMGFLFYLLLLRA